MTGPWEGSCPLGGANMADSSTVFCSLLDPRTMSGDRELDKVAVE